MGCLGGAARAAQKDAAPDADAHGWEQRGAAYPVGAARTRYPRRVEREGFPDPGGCAGILGQPSRMRVPGHLMAQVRQRAEERCEYCRMSQRLQGAAFHIEHIRPIVLGGETCLDNLAIACPSCNLHKADRISAVDPGHRPANRVVPSKGRLVGRSLPLEWRAFNGHE